MTKLTKSLSVVFIIALVAFTPDPKPENITVTLPQDSWSKILASLRASENVSAKDANDISQQIIDQANKQINADSTKATTQKTK